ASPCGGTGTVARMPKPLYVARRLTCNRFVRDESGVALVMALAVMTAMTAMLTTTLFFTSTSYRDAQRSTAGAKAYSLAEAGLNNALAVLNGNYPGTIGYPGDSTLLPSRTTKYTSGSTTWSGLLVAVTGQPWRFEWP